MKRKISTVNLAFFTLAAAGGLFLISFFFGGFASYYSSSTCQSQLIETIHQYSKAGDSASIAKLNKALKQAESQDYDLSCGALKDLLDQN